MNHRNGHLIFNFCFKVVGSNPTNAVSLLASDWPCQWISTQKILNLKFKVFCIKVPLEGAKKQDCVIYRKTWKWQSAMKRDFLTKNILNIAVFHFLCATMVIQSDGEPWRLWVWVLILKVPICMKRQAT